MATQTTQASPGPTETSVREPRYKRPFDLTILLIAHIALAPVWLVLWIAIPIAIKLDDGGPVFYTQKRMGRGGRQFNVRKFRSMVNDAEKGTGAVWAKRNDPRITRIGRILRHTALDELPQVLNVWNGDMSLVGPRPERPELHEQIRTKTPEFEKRLLVRPGMAGMAQVYGRYDLSPPEKLVFDLRYTRSMSIFMDIKLLTLAALNTVFARWGHATAVSPAATPAATSTPLKSQVPSNVLPFSTRTEASTGTGSEEEQDEGLDLAA